MKKRVIKAWAIVNVLSGAIYHHDFREMYSIYADEEEAKTFAEPTEGEEVVEVEIHLPPHKPKKK